MTRLLLSSALLSSAIVSSAVLGLAGPAYAGSVLAQRVPEPKDQPEAAPSLPDRAPGAFKPDADSDATADAPAGAPSDVWIFSGSLENSHEAFSGTLVAGKGQTQFELKLGNGATCDGKDLAGEVGLVRLKEITCSDDRSMKALFVPQGGQELKVFGHVGDERFVASAHLLGTEPLPEKKQTAEPTAPALKDRPGREPPATAPTGK